MPLKYEISKAAEKVLALQKAETEASRKVERGLSAIQRTAESQGGKIYDSQRAALSKANDDLNKAESAAGAALINFAQDYLEGSGRTSERTNDS